MHSNAGVRSDLFPRPLTETLLTDFFGSVSEVELQSGLPPVLVASPFNSSMPNENRARRRNRRRAVEKEEVLMKIGGGFNSEKIAIAALVLAGLQVVALFVSRRGGRIEK